MNEIITTRDIEERIIEIRGQKVLLDRDVAAIYGVEAKHVNQAVRNNPEKFPEGYLITLQSTEIQELVKNFDRFTTLKHSITGKAFTEKGLYMLATVLKSRRATETTIAIIETFAMVREMARSMEAMQKAEDGSDLQKELLQHTGEVLAHVVGENLPIQSTETEIELNLALVKIKHKVIRKGNGDIQGSEADDSAR